MTHRRKILVFLGGGVAAILGIAAWAMHSSPSHTTEGAMPSSPHVKYAAPLEPLDHGIPVPPDEGFANRKVLGFHILSAVPGYPLPGHPRIAAVTTAWQFSQANGPECFGGQFSGPGRNTWLQTSAGPVYPTSALMDASVNPMQQQDSKLWNNAASGGDYCAGYEVELASAMTVTLLNGKTQTLAPGIPTITGTLYYALPNPTAKVYSIVWTHSDWPSYEVANPAYHH